MKKALWFIGIMLLLATTAAEVYLWYLWREEAEPEQRRTHALLSALNAVAAALLIVGN